MLSSGASDGQVTLEAHHASARKILLAVQQQLDLLETGRDTSIEIQSEISQRLNTLSREVQTIEELLPYAASDKRKVWGRRVQQLKADQCAQSALARSSPCGTTAEEAHRRAQGYYLGPRGVPSRRTDADEKLRQRSSACPKSPIPLPLAIQDDSRRESAALAKYATQQYNQQREFEEREALLQRRNNTGADSHAISIDALQKESQSLSSARASLVTCVVVLAAAELATCGSRRPHASASRPSGPPTEQSYGYLGPAAQPWGFSEAPPREPAPLRLATQALPARPPDRQRHGGAWLVGRAALLAQGRPAQGARYSEHPGRIQQRHTRHREPPVLGQDARLRGHAADAGAAVARLRPHAQGCAFG